MGLGMPERERLRDLLLLAALRLRDLLLLPERERERDRDRLLRDRLLFDLRTLERIEVILPCRAR